MRATPFPLPVESQQLAKSERSHRPIAKTLPSPRHHHFHARRALFLTKRTQTHRSPAASPAFACTCSARSAQQFLPASVPSTLIQIVSTHRRGRKYLLPSPSLLEAKIMKSNVS